MMKKSLKTVVTLGLAAGLVAVSSVAALGAPRELASHKDWKAYISKESNGNVCFVVSAPKDQSPKGVNRGDVLFIVTDWGNSHWQPQVQIGYPFKSSSKATVQIGSDRFDLFTDNDGGGDGGAWLRAEADETRLVRSMKRGSSMIVKGTSKRGTLTTDRYSLSGITAALDAAAKACK